MELAAWRDAVPYGAYLQPIHLQVAGPDAAHATSSAVQESPSKSTHSAPHSSQKPVEGSADGTPEIPQPPEPSADTGEAQNAAQSIDETKDVTVIPPFASECLNNGEQMALNVGGPVWAMDWLPSKPAANAAAVAAALVKTKQKNGRRTSAAAKKAAKKTAKGKENNQVETLEGGEITAASNGSAEAEEGGQQNWRFLALATHPPCQVEDGKLVKATPPDHYYDVPESERNLIQIWAVPVNRPSTTGTGQNRKGKVAKRKLVKPRLVYAIDHDSGVAWDLQWCPLVKKFPKADRRENILGVLAACFGDGSMRVFEIPAIADTRLQMSISKEAVVEKSIPVVIAKLPRILQLSVQWSPHNWNMLLTGGSDGSVSLWNIKSAITERDSLGNLHTTPEPVEPQRRYQDADTIGKQEAFDWGCGWVAIRAVAWSPFDEHLFATTGNDSVFKVWDVREPRVCLRSHRIRSTWGLAIQWMDQTSIQISGDQGSVYMYDILSGSYQKLHFHPQIDSPVWDLHFARRGAVPLLVSSCTSGSIRAAPAKKLYRAPQNCVEICRLSGKRDATVEQPFKSLTVSFERHSVLGTADAVSLNTRAFCERDAALHRLRLSSITPGDYPCYLAAGGHAGLVILLELQEAFDTLVSTFFLPPSKKIGRPKKMFATVGGHHSPKTGSNKQTEIPVPATSAGRKIRTLGSYAKAKGMHTALSKYKKASGKGKAKAKLQKQKKSFIQEDGEVEVEDSIEDEEEPEYVEDDEEDEESDVSVLIEDSSDDDRVSVSTDEVEEEETPATTSNPEEARLMKEYQLDLSEEDAYLLALQMSEFDDGPPASASEVNKDTPSSVRNPQEPQTKVVAQQSANGNIKAKPKAKAKSKTTAKAKVAVKTKVTTKASKRRSRPSSSTAKKTNEVGVTDADPGAEENPKANAGDKQASGEVECKESTPALVEKAAIPLTTTAVTASPKKTKLKQPKKAPTRKPSPKTKRESPMLLEAINQAMAWQAFEYQLGMSEEDALKEALRLSEIGDTTRSSRSNQPVLSEPVSAALPTPTQPKQTPATPRTKGASQKKQKKVKDLKEPEAKSDAVSTEERSRPQTPRRLEFSPLNGSEGGDHVEVPPANIDSEPAAVSPAAPAVETSASAPAIAPSPKEPSPKKSPALQAAKPTSEKQNKTAKSPTSATQTPKKKPAERKQPASASAAVPATPQGKKPIKRARSTGAKPAGPQPKKRKKTATPRGGRQHSGASNDAVMSEEDALLLALKMSEIEY